MKQSACTLFPSICQAGTIYQIGNLTGRGILQFPRQMATQ